MLQRVHADYARAIHLRLRRVGHLWQARYASVPMDENHFWATMVYVEQNPSKAHLCEHPWDFRWSSARAHLADSDGGLLDLVRWRARYTPERWKRCLELGLADSLTLERIRESTQKGWPLGDDAFLKRLETEFAGENGDRDLNSILYFILNGLCNRNTPGRPAKPKTSVAC